jgi:hypothetical protein
MPACQEELKKGAWTPEEVPMVHVLEHAVQQLYRLQALNV